MIIWDNSDYLMHYGIKGRSGRYPAGSGENPKTGPRANRKLATLQAKKEKNQKKIDKFYSRPKLPNGMSLTEFGVAKEKRLLRKERKLDAKIRKIEKSQKQKAEEHDFNNPKFSDEEWSRESAKVLSKYKDPYTLKPEHAAKIAGELMQKTNEIAAQGEKALRNGDRKKARELQLKGFVYHQAATEYLEAEDYLYKTRRYPAK